MIDDGYGYDPNSFYLTAENIKASNVRVCSYLEDSINSELIIDSLNPNATLAVLDIIFAICFLNYGIQVNEETPELGNFVLWITDLYIGDLSIYKLNDIQLISSYVLSALGVDRQEVMILTPRLAMDVLSILEKELDSNKAKVAAQFMSYREIIKNSDLLVNLNTQECSGLNENDLLKIATQLLLNITDLFGWDLRQYFIDTYETAIRHYAQLVSNFLSNNYPIFSQVQDLESKIYLNAIIDLRIQPPLYRFSNS